MSDNEFKKIGRKIEDTHLRMADLVIELLKEHTDSPEDACIVVLLAHAKLWHLYGETSNGNVSEMLAGYISDFFTLMEIMKKYPLPTKDGMLQ